LISGKFFTNQPFNFSANHPFLIPASVFIASFLRRKPFIGSVTIELQAADQSSKDYTTSMYNASFLNLRRKKLMVGLTYYLISNENRIQ
jgi:hypothetical protein